MRFNVISLMLEHMMLIYLLVYTLFNDSVCNSDHIVLNDWKAGILNWKGCERKWLRPNLSTTMVFHSRD
jgi:hypothetical protein